MYDLSFNRDIKKIKLIDAQNGLVVARGEGSGVGKMDELLFLF